MRWAGLAYVARASTLRGMVLAALSGLVCTAPASALPATRVEAVAAQVESALARPGTEPVSPCTGWSGYSTQGSCSLAFCYTRCTDRLHLLCLGLSRQVERLERDHQHEAAVARLHTVLETYTDVTRFPKCASVS